LAILYSLNMSAYSVNPWSMIPFGLLLVLIAMMPLLAHHWWERHYPKVAFGLGAITVTYYLGVLHEFHRPLETVHEYLSFLCLVGSLFVVSGGIHIGVKGEAKPWVNVVILAVGGVLANFIGTTGASMLLIRPYIRANRYRITTFHIVFFIFIVSNVGGSLTPIGDPPLYLGFLEGIPFFWTAKTLWPMWLVGMLWLLGIFYILDRRNFLRAPKEVREKETSQEVWSFDGWHNLIWLAMILAALFVNKPLFLREALMVMAALGSWISTKHRVYEINQFTWMPIREVAILFAGIFATMMPALDWLEKNATQLGVSSVSSFYWGSGILSSVLDNAPTYLNFLSAAKGLFGQGSPDAVAYLVQQHGQHLAAMSIGAVFFGACTYIGNGPNFMVKSIADHCDIKMPSFFGYVIKFTLPILLPLLVLIGFLFFR
jgi:Na+/H+ antiporter NhaD/arsenite permease-like protein